MTVLAFRVFAGEVPRLPRTLLPENASQDAVNCDLAHGELRSLHGNRTIATTLASGQQIKGVYGEDGTFFFGWPYDTWAVKSMVPDDAFFRVYYTQVLPDGPIAKVARTHRNTNGIIEPVIGSSVLIGGNYQPPEASTPVSGNFKGPDSWLLGVPRPKVQADIVEDNLRAELTDKAAWPGIPRLQLRVTFLLETPTGEIVAQHDLTNLENAVLFGITHPAVWYTNDSSLRGHKVQDMLWPLGYSSRPYKYYWFDPPRFEEQTVARTITLTADASTSFEYGNVVTAPPPGPGTELPSDQHAGQQ